MDVARYTSATGRNVRILYDGTVFDSDDALKEYLINDKKFSESIAVSFVKKVQNRTLPLKEWNMLLKDKGLYQSRPTKTKKKA